MDFGEYGSQVLEWLEGVQRSRGIDADRTLQLCGYIKEYATEQEDERLLGYACYYSGETYYLLNDVENLFRSISCSLPYLEHSRQHGLLARAYNLLAITSMNRGNAPFAMDYYLNALMYCNKYHLDDVGIMIHINIGVLYNNFGEYRRAQEYLERGLALLQKHPDIPEYYSYLTNIYVGMGNSLLHRNHLGKAQEYLLAAEKDCAVHMEEMDRAACDCFAARLYNAMGKYTQRDACMDRVHGMVNDRMPILDIFEDLYEYCELLFAISDEEELWYFLELLEGMARQAKVINMQKRILGLKIRYYKIREDHEKYLQASGMFYELSELLEKENRYMVTNILNMRYMLEETRKSRHEMEQKNRILLQQSQTDALTGLANRYLLNTYAEDAFRRAAENGAPLAVEILDIDYFKQYNDNYGHQAGDGCICRIAEELHKLEQEERIFCARYGGDEFIVIYENCTREEVERYARQLKQGILDMAMEHKYSLAVPYVTISQGICYDMPGKDQKAWDYLHTADNMLYKAKKNRNSVKLGSCDDS